MSRHARRTVAFLVTAFVAASTSAGHAQFRNLDSAVSSDGGPVEDLAALRVGRTMMQGYRGDGPHLTPGETNDARASVRGASAPVDAERMSKRYIIGNDNLVRVQPTTNYPTRAIARISYFAPATKQSLYCTGFLVSKNLVATRGSCVFHYGNNKKAWSEMVRVAVGQDGFQKPYGECRGTRLFSVRGWTQHKDERYDYGAIKLDCDIGLTTGFFGLAEQPDSLLIGHHFYAGGYPAPVVPPTYTPAGSQWQGYGRVLSTSSRLLFFSADTYGYMGGGPLWNNFPGCTDVACAVAILLDPHRSGSTKHNAGVRILAPIFNNYFNWSGGGGGVIL
jgi:glutamyl endopeptidase